MFATLPCSGKRRLAIVVGRCLQRMYCEQLLPGQREKLLVDVCWERMKFRVICSHLNPGSVEHMYGDAEDLSMLVTTRVKDAHVHICADAQTRLSTVVPCPPKSNIGTATTVTHRAEKQRLLECFIMENSLTATNTFSNNDARNTTMEHQHLHVQLQLMTRTTAD